MPANEVLHVAPNSNESTHAMEHLSLDELASQVESGVLDDVLKRALSDQHEAQVSSVVYPAAEQMQAASPSQPPHHLGQIVFKTVADCNLRCRYPCYEYEDESWRLQPARASFDTFRRLGARIGQYTLRHALDEMAVVIHGGEPFFMRHPEEYYDTGLTLLTEAAQKINPNIKLRYSVQTNGLLLTESLLDILDKHEVGVGVSIDGNKLTHDKRRVTKGGGKGSYDLMMRGLTLLKSDKYKHLFRSILGVIDIESDPLEYYNALVEHDPPRVDLLLPFGNYDSLPPGLTGSNAPYAPWLLKIFKRWFYDVSAPDVRTFTSLGRSILGGASYTEAYGLNTGSEVVVNPSGSYELSDALKIVADNLQVTGLDLKHDNLEKVAKLMREQGFLGLKPVAEDCAPCKLLEVCGGGHIENRYSSKDKYNNRSVYCADLMILIRGMTSIIRETIFKGELNRLQKDLSVACPDCVGFPLNIKPEKPDAKQPRGHAALTLCKQRSALFARFARSHLRFLRFRLSEHGYRNKSGKGD